ncbi:hypothetical protein DC366_18915 [Pelagivirga sediminicola]|uniref:Uncharacterized protein n=1 Tax=Pelagivirga sediminicola TaxID=2170575 RepID=A0A2T7G262_9RHOB|nr:hypothetical protein [Pelagivirga sediminicola]PVA08496.1 hypothetical protein DC366_18915 [Pelagivirga sediminicola]
MKPDTLEPLTVSTDTDIVLNQLRELQKDIRALAPLLDLLRTPQGQEEQDMIRRLLSTMTNVEAHLTGHTDRQAQAEETQAHIQQQLKRLERKVTDLHRGLMPLVGNSDMKVG